MLHIKQTNTLPKERMAYLPYSRHLESQLVGEFLEEKGTIFREIQQCFKRSNVLKEGESVHVEWVNFLFLKYELPKL